MMDEKRFCRGLRIDARPHDPHIGGVRGGVGAAGNRASLWLHLSTNAQEILIRSVFTVAQ